MWFAFFILHAEGVAFVIDQENLDFAIGAVVLVVGGAVSEDVLVADGLVDLRKDVGEFALEDGSEAETTGHPSEGLHLVLSLEVVELAWATASSEFVEKRSSADGKDGDVGGTFDFGQDLVEG